jgi:hypothetical protein
MKMQIRFRPSSHSEDVSLVATYNNVKTAKKVAGRLKRFVADCKNNPKKYDLDWSADEAQISATKNKVNFYVYTAGYLEEVEAIIAAENPVDYLDYQGIDVTVTLPKALTTATMALVLTPEEVEMLKWLKLILGRPKVKSNGKILMLNWHYHGNEIKNNPLNIGGKKFKLDKHPNWQARHV